MCRRCPPTAALTERLRPDLVLVTGDMVAGQRAGLDYGAMWAGWHRAVTDPLRAAGIPMAVTPGNHDASGYAQYAAERSVFVSQWTAPSRVPRVTLVDRSRYPLRYSFANRGAFFVSLDATTVGPMSAEPRQWVDAQLAASTAPVKIAFGHLSLHPATVGRETEVLADAELEAILRRRGLTVYVSGHPHDRARRSPRRFATARSASPATTSRASETRAVAPSGGAQAVVQRRRCSVRTWPSSSTVSSTSACSDQGGSDAGRAPW